MKETREAAKVIFLECGLGGGSVNRLSTLLRHWDFARFPCGVLSFYDQLKARELLAIPDVVFAQTLGIQGLPPDPLRTLAGLATPTRHFFSYGGRVLRLLREHRDALLYLNNTPYPHTPAIVAAALLSRRVVCHLRDTVVLSRAERLCLPGIRHFIALSEAAKRHYVAQGIPPEKLTTVYDSIDIARLGGQVFEGEVPRGGKNAVIVGSLCDRKAQDVAIRALATVTLRHPETQLLLIGDGSAMEHWQVLARDIGVSSNVHFMGYQPAAFDVLRRCDIGILPSRREGLPNSVMEYMAARLPVLVSDLTGIRELVADGREGFIHPVGDSEKLAADWIRLLDDRELRRKMGSAGWVSVSRREFSPEFEAETISGVIFHASQV